MQINKLLKKKPIIKKKIITKQIKKFNNSKIKIKLNNNKKKFKKNQKILIKMI